MISMPRFIVKRRYRSIGRPTASPSTPANWAKTSSTAASTAATSSVSRSENCS
jgi:hypothetical protein